MYAPPIEQQGLINMNASARWLVALLIVLGAGSAQAATAAGDPAAQCAAMVGQYPDIVDAPTNVTAAKMVDAADGLPAFCQVNATIKPDIGIELRLPSATWNGKFFEYGRGGYCRTISMQDCNNPLRKGYACVITDHGHKSTEQDDIWVRGNIQAKVDCGFRGTHVAAASGKALTAAYYHKEPTHSYYMGCSTGGRLGMVEAEKFPWDFDGIIAGAAPISKFADGLALMWDAIAPLDKTGKQILSPADIEMVHKAAVAKCDMDDGIADGVIGDPMHCKFDPAELQCHGAQAQGKGAACLSPEQVTAVRKMYQGPVTSKGVSLYPGPLPGSELDWIGTFIADKPGPSPIYTGMTDMFVSMNDPERPPEWKITDFNWDEDYKRLAMMDALNSGANPDLRPFKAAGGKLIVYHGLADSAVMPGNMVDFYQIAERTMGGEAATKDFFRLFLMPGLNHCTGGAGASVFDYIAALEAWVEGGKAPDALIGAHPKTNIASPVPLPLDPANIAFTRPVFPYPARAVYSGKGDPNDAASFTPAAQ
jgi:feruloyl esterase